MSSVEAVTFEPVIATLDQSGLDLAKCIVHGGAVLAWHNLRAAGDVDVLLEPSYYAEISRAGQTPSGRALAESETIKGRRRMVSDPAEDLLKLDLSTFSSLGKGLRFAYHRRMTSESLESRIGSLNLTRLAYVFYQKTNQECARDKADVTLLNQFYGQLETV